MFNLTFIVPSVKELIIDRFDATTTEASLFVTVEMVAYIIFAMVWGAASDKAGTRKVFIVVGFLGSSVLYFAMSLAPDLITLLVLRFLQGAMTVMAWSLIMTMALDITDRKEYGASMGLIGTGLALGLGLGAPVGGWLAYASIFAVVGLSSSATQVGLVLVVCGIFAAMLLPATLAIIGDIAPPGEHATFMGGLNAFGSLGFAVGPIVAAVFSDSLGYQDAFILGGVVVLGPVLGSVPFLKRIKPNRTNKKRHREKEHAHYR